MVINVGIKFNTTSSIKYYTISGYYSDCWYMFLLFQILMNVQLTLLDVVKHATTLLDHFIVSVMMDMHCLMIEKHVEI